MPGLPRRRVDLTRLPTPWRYALAFAGLAVGVALALLLGDGASDDGQTAGWYTVLVRIGAVLLLAYGVFWIARRVIKARQRQ
jgi:hypothetical protein